MTVRRCCCSFGLYSIISGGNNELKERRDSSGDSLLADEGIVTTELLNAGSHKAKNMEKVQARDIAMLAHKDKQTYFMAYYCEESEPSFVTLSLKDAYPTK